MKVIKRINNNTVLCADSRGRDVVAFGKGIAFAAPKGSDELPLAAIERTFYNIDAHYLDLLETISSEVIDVAADVVETFAPALSYELGPNAVLALADHISFAIERQRKGMEIAMPLAYEVRQMYPVEYRAGLYALELVDQRLHVTLRNQEVAGMALCLINSALASDASNSMPADASSDDSIVDAATSIIERRYGIAVDRDGFSFARFATHMHYLLDRIHSRAEPLPGDPALYQSARENDELAAACTDEICALIATHYPAAISDEERLYILLHVNRIAGRRES